MAMASWLRLASLGAFLWPHVAVGDGMIIPKRSVSPGVEMPVVSIGTGGLESKDAREIVRTWMDLGGRGIDTALIYRNQASVTEGIADAGRVRSEVFITTKIPGCAGYSATKKMVEADLHQLSTDFIDMLLIHSPYGFDCPGTWSALEDLHKAGTLHAIGVSNFESKHLEVILKNATVPPAVNQIKHSVMAHDTDTVAFCVAHNITIEAYSPLGRNSSAIFVNPTITAIAQSHSVSNPQVALRWILQHGHILTFQSSSRKHQAEDADLFTFELTSQEMAVLDKLQGDHSETGLRNALFL